MATRGPQAHAGIAQLSICLLLLAVLPTASGCSAAGRSSSQGSATHTGLHYSPGYTGDTEGSVYFLPDVSYIEAVRTVAELGLQPLSPCLGAASDHTPWKSANQSLVFNDVDSKGLLQVTATPLSPTGWPQRLLATKGIVGVSVGPVYCPNIGGDITPISGQMYFLGHNTQPDYVQVTFSNTQGDSYAISIVEMSDLGFRLADPCFESQRPSPQWHAMSQLSAYEAKDTLVLATTEANSSRWLAQLSNAHYVTRVETPYHPVC